MARDQDDDDFDDVDSDELPPKKKGSAKEDRQMAMFCHLGMLLAGFIVPLVIWIMKKEESKFVDRHGKEALNFAITITLVHLVGPCTFFILNLVAMVLSIIWAIKGAMAANNGEDYEYPVNFRFIK